jgi:DNA-binding MarR family transcriptional regulator
MVPSLDIPPLARPFLEAATLDDLMTCRQVAVLIIAAGNPAQSTKDIASTLGAPVGAISRAAQKLAGLGLLDSIRDAGDRRRVQLAPSPAGTAAIARIAAAGAGA